MLDSNRSPLSAATEAALCGAPAAAPASTSATAPKPQRTWRKRLLPWLLAGKAGALLVVGALSLASASSVTAQAQPASAASLPASGPAAGASVLAAQAATLSAFASFTRALQGDESAIEGCAAEFAKLSAAAPSDLVLLAYAGASHAMQARTTMLPWKKMKFADDGLAQLDKALALLPASYDAPAYRQRPALLDVKFTAASTFLALPSMFHRQERGQKLLDDVANSPLLKTAPAPFQASVAALVQKSKGN